VSPAAKPWASVTERDLRSPGIGAGGNVVKYHPARSVPTQPMGFLAVIERLGDTPAQWIFECASCRALKWIAEEVGMD
jgi:hypothetical protein